MSESSLINLLSLAKLTWTKCSLRPKSRCLRRPQRGSLSGRMKGGFPISCLKPKVCYTNSPTLCVLTRSQVPDPNLVAGPPTSQGGLQQATKNRVNSQARRFHHRTLPLSPHDLALRIVQGVEARRWMRCPPARMVETTDQWPRQRPHRLLARNAPRRQHEHGHGHARARASPAAYLGASRRADDHPPPRRAHDPLGLVPKGRSLRRPRVSGPVRRPGTRRRKEAWWGRKEWMRKKRASSWALNMF
jgi:hypothetical protein